MQKNHKKLRFTAKLIAYSAVCTAIVTALTLCGFSSSAFYFNLGDAAILISSAIFGPVVGAICGGLGSFFADLAVYPATMLYTLVIKGAEGLIAGSLVTLFRKKIKNKPAQVSLSAVALAFSAFFMMTGYLVCQTFFYGTKASALVALPMDAVQASVSFAVAFVVLYPMKLVKLSSKVYFDSPVNKKEKQTEDSRKPSEEN